MNDLQVLNPVPVPIVEGHMAKLIITFGGSLGELPDAIAFDATDAQIKTWAQEAVRGGIPGIQANAGADLNDFVVDRFPATGDLPNRTMVRPKTPFGV